MEMTFGNIITFAVESEQKAAELYRHMKSLAKSPEAKVMFTELEAEERKHEKFFKDITADDIPTLPTQEVTDLRISDYLVNVSFKPDMSYQDILIMAMKREESSTKLYSDLASRIDDPEMKKLLEFMSKEEAKHKLRLETEYDENVLAED